MLSWLRTEVSASMKTVVKVHTYVAAGKLVDVDRAQLASSLMAAAKLSSNSLGMDVGVKLEMIFSPQVERSLTSWPEAFEWY